VIKVLDVNLSPAWTEMLATKGIEGVHWSSISLASPLRRFEPDDRPRLRRLPKNVE
jgi:hypothetical protein